MRGRLHERLVAIAIAAGVVVGTPAVLGASVAPEHTMPTTRPTLPSETQPVESNAGPSLPDGAVPEPNDPNAQPPQLTPFSDPSLVIESWHTDANFYLDNDLPMLTATETLQLTSSEGKAGQGFVHTIALVPSLDPAQELNRIVSFSAVVPETGEQLPVTVTLGEPRNDDLVSIAFEVQDDRPGLDVSTYALSYTVLDPFIEVAEDGPAELAFSLGPTVHGATIVTYDAQVRITDQLVQMITNAPKCIVIFASGTVECGTIGPINDVVYTSDGAPLGANEHLLLTFAVDLWAHEHTPAPTTEATEMPERQPEDTVISEPATPSLDAPEWTRYAAGAGLVAIGAAGLWLSRRKPSVG